jgi:hypothetical protein
MDRFIAALDAEDDGDLALCIADGVAYQKDRTHIICYDEPYYRKCQSHEDQEIARRLYTGRIALVDRHFGPGRVVDIGIGSGEFIKKRGNTFGFDVNPVAIEWLKRNDLWAENLEWFGAHTMWDVIEHIETPEQMLRNVQLHGFAFFSIPVFQDLRRIRESKHYRPGEHLYYWTDEGFRNWMRCHGFLLLEVTDFETQAGRESIMSYAFKRVAWPKSN